MKIKEYSLKTDQYKNPTVSEGQKAVGILLVRIIELEPGKDPLHPDMGVGLKSKYRYMNESDIPKLRSSIEKQVNTYLPQLIAIEVNISLNEDKALRIEILSDNTMYSYETSADTSNQITTIGKLKALSKN